MTIEATRGSQAVLKALRRMCIQCGGQRAFARSVGISPSTLADVLNGRKTISARMARLAGFERHRVTVYKPAGKP